MRSLLLLAEFDGDRPGLIDFLLTFPDFLSVRDGVSGFQSALGLFFISSRAVAISRVRWFGDANAFERTNALEGSVRALAISRVRCSGVANAFEGTKALEGVSSVMDLAFLVECLGETNG